jgi:hypothetical protein
MSDKRFLGNIITPTPTAPAGPFQDGAASGTWSLQEAFSYVKAGLWPTAGNQKPLIEDVFSTYLYTGNGSTQTITNGIDLAGEGGLVWVKDRGVVRDHVLSDTERGGSVVLNSNTTDAQSSYGSAGFTFNSDGFTLGNTITINRDTNTFTSWTFRKAPRFFDCVEYTGDGNGTSFNHDLGVAPAVVIVKATSGVDGWIVYHHSISAPTSNYLRLDLTNASAALYNWISVSDTSVTFPLGYGPTASSGTQYVAYLFAHDPLGPSGDGSDGLIACGSYTGNGSSNGPEIDLGWEPQWVLVKAATGGAEEWFLYDSMRGWLSNATAVLGNKALRPNDSAVEWDNDFSPYITSTGFELNSSSSRTNASGVTYIYIAIRRGPMRAPESGTEVFAPVKRLEVSTDIMPTNTGFATDLVIHKPRITGSAPWFLASRLQGDDIALSSNSTAAEASYAAIIGDGFWKFDSNDGAYIGSGGYYNNSGNTSPNVSYSFLRAPSFFDVVAYTGNGIAGRTVPHNLGVAPEMMIVKNRSGSSSWIVYHFGLNNNVVPEQYYLPLESTSPESQLILFNNTAPTSTDFTVHSSTSVNGSGSNYVAYLFSTLAGISKVGFYTGNGSSQTINCGFTTGARFVLIRRYNSSGGDWYVWDTAQGIVTGDDPNLSLNTTAAVEPSNDSIDLDSSGFIVNQVGANNINVSAARYIFYAVA